MEHHSTPSKNK